MPQLPIHTTMANYNGQFLPQCSFLVRMAISCCNGHFLLQWLIHAIMATSCCNSHLLLLRPTPLQSQIHATMSNFCYNGHFLCQWPSLAADVNSCQNNNTKQKYAQTILKLRDCRKTTHNYSVIGSTVCICESFFQSAYGRHISRCV